MLTIMVLLKGLIAQIGPPITIRLLIIQIERRPVGGAQRPSHVAVWFILGQGIANKTLGPIGTGRPRTACPDGAECFIRNPLTEDEPHCHMTGPLCPPNWTALDLNDEQTDRYRWTYLGNQALQQDHYGEHGEGTCFQWISTGMSDLYQFTIPLDGD